MELTGQLKCVTDRRGRRRRTLRHVPPAPCGSREDTELPAAVEELTPGAGLGSSCGSSSEVEEACDEG